MMAAKITHKKEHYGKSLQQKSSRKHGSARQRNTQAAQADSRRTWRPRKRSVQIVHLQQNP